MLCLYGRLTATLQLLQETFDTIYSLHPLNAAKWQRGTSKERDELTHRKYRFTYWKRYIVWRMRWHVRETTLPVMLPMGSSTPTCWR